ncbi:hypothetical protein INT45_009421 [Circinella minor]|uniref:Uncharacterized protein n=1 Tax=Circinella minor TaxID=1195481 RepID=A0A8H7S460_9FUNG|nr:hypothetical protein INT45_009421 [Circinella minor]
MVLADLPSMKIRARTLRLKFASRLPTLPTSTMARSAELSFLWDKHQPDQQWRKITIDNPLHQLYNTLRNNLNPPKFPVTKAINEKREEYIFRRNRLKTIKYMRNKQFIINNTPPKSEIGLSSGKWKAVWPAFIRVLREIDILGRPNEIFDVDEPAPDEALELPIINTAQNEQ